MKGYIYKIQPTVEHQPNEIYIGSTTKTLNERLQKHKYSYSDYLKGNFHSKVSMFELFDKYGINNFDIILLDEIEFNDKKQLTKLEGEYIKSNKCVNRKIEGRTKKETDKSYREKNKDKLREYIKKYQDDNKDRINNHRKQKNICNICNGKYTHQCKSIHIKTSKHQKALNNHQPVINIHVENLTINN
jgi:hypothetical protein